MAYQVLARKWRPRAFAEMVGQPHVVRALTNALEQDRLHHAYLFTGTRGVGKTTVARILAKCLNCEAGVSATPCGVCASCQEIDEGRFVDLIEVDAASRTKVEDTRDLLDNVQYAPARGRFKVYLIDEVHMLSSHSFNALLKTLEEPPPHVKFLLATTDPQKLPVTVLSRCLQFHLKRMPAGLIVEHLGRLLGEESVDAEPAALALLAQSADGSMRDALSLLDQAIAYGGGRLVESEIREMLGVVPGMRVAALIEAVMAGEAAGLFAQLDALAGEAPDYEAVLDALIAALHRLAVMQALGDTGAPEAAEEVALGALVDKASPEDVQLWYQIALTGRRDLPLSPAPRAGLEMVLLRMLSFRPAELPAAPQTAAPGATRSGSSTAQRAPTPGQAQAEPPSRLASPAGHKIQPEQAEAPPQAHAGAEPPAPDGLPQDGAEWGRCIAALRLRGAARELAANCAWGGGAGDRIQLRLAPSHEQLRSTKSVERLQAALSEHFGRSLRVEVLVQDAGEDTPAQARQRSAEATQARAEAAIADDDVARALIEQFGAELIPGSVQPTGKPTH
jgi:DNA polymerase-3 subunit gamma/tau